MKKAQIEKELKEMSDGKKTHVVHLNNNGKHSTSTVMGKGVSVKKLSIFLRRTGWEVEVI